MGQNQKVYKTEYTVAWFIAETFTCRALQLGMIIFWIAIWGVVKGYWFNELTYIAGIPLTVVWIYVWSIIQIALLTLVYFLSYQYWGTDLDKLQEKDPSIFAPPENHSWLFDVSHR